MGKKDHAGAPEPPAYAANLRAVRGTLENAKGIKLATYCWLPSTGAPRGVAMAIHGISSHSMWDWMRTATYGGATGRDAYASGEFSEPRYEGSLVERLNNAGIAVVAADAQSYGLSEGARGLRGYFERFEDMVDDLIQLRREVVSGQFEGLPVFLLGGSMGGNLAVRVLQRDEDFAYGGAVLFAPMMSVEQLKKKPINRVLLPLSGFVSWAAPTLRIAKKEVHLSKEWHANLCKDPLVETQDIRARVAFECLAAVERARADVKRVTCSLLVFHSANDTMVDIHGSEFLVKECASQDATFSRREEEGLWHALCAEPGREAIMSETVAWILARLAGPSQGAAAASVQQEQEQEQESVETSQVQVATS